MTPSKGKARPRLFEPRPWVEPSCVRASEVGHVEQTPWHLLARQAAQQDQEREVSSEPQKTTPAQGQEQRLAQPSAA